MPKLLTLFLFASLITATAPAAARAPDAQPIAEQRLTFMSRDGLTLNYVVYSATSTAVHPVVISPGCGESAYRYEALVGDLRARGYGPIYVLEHRGQGFSEGTGARADVVHVDHFGEYVTDFTDFMRGPVASDLAARRITSAPDVIAHSMGGAIANLALRDDQTLVRRIAYVAPMMDINTAVLNPMHDRLALWAAEALCAAGLCERLSVAGLGRKRRLKIPGVVQELRDGIFRGGVTPGWLVESIRATRRIQAEAYAHAEPSLMITALNDLLVGNRALRTYAAQAQDCVLREIDGPHGLHHDVDARKILVKVIDEFFRECEHCLAN